MEDYILSCCSTADLTKEHFDDRNIRYICFHYESDGKEYPDDLGQSIPLISFIKQWKTVQRLRLTRLIRMNLRNILKKCL